MAFLHKHDISIVNVENLITLLYNKDDSISVLSCPKSCPCTKISHNSIPSSATKLLNLLSTKLTPTFLMNRTNSPILQPLYPTGEVQELQDVVESLVVDDRL